MPRWKTTLSVTHALASTTTTTAIADAIVLGRTWPAASASRCVMPRRPRASAMSAAAMAAASSRASAQSSGLSGVRPTTAAVRAWDRTLDTVTARTATAAKTGAATRSQCRASPLTVTRRSMSRAIVRTSQASTTPSA